MIAFIALLLLTSSTPAAHPGSPAFGKWVTKDKSLVEMYPCGDRVCGKLVHVSGNYTVDTNNPNAALRARPLCGLDIATGFRMTDATHISDGHLYDPESGKTYSGVMTVDGDVLKLRGYVGIPLFGRTETWHRASGPTPGCNK